MKKALAPVLCAALLTTSAGIVSVSADNTTVSSRQVEYLGRGGSKRGKAWNAGKALMKK